MMSESGMTRGDVLGQRSASPPGRESREDWRGGQRSKISPARRSRSRSRSPGGRRASSQERAFRYEKDGTNTTSDEPHLQRARLFVGNIEPSRVRRRDLLRLFSRYGDVIGVSVHQGYAFVQMDRERSANKAINYEDNKVFNGCRIRVEFSQAALKAGAKFTAEREAAYDSPPRIERAAPPPPLPHLGDSLALLEVEREREERLARILRMERELAYLRTRDEYEPANSRRAHFDSHDKGETFRRGSPPMRDSGFRSHAQDEFAYTRSEERRALYNRPLSPGALPRGGPSSGGSYHDREPISYPMPGSSRGSGGASREGHLMQYGGYSGLRGLTSLAVGYGAGSGMSKVPGSSGVPPPGWPSTDHDKANANRPPFANAGPWS